MALKLIEEAREERPLKKRKPRSRTLSIFQLEAEIYRDNRLISPEELDLLERIRPKVRAECKDGLRPCPFVGCEFHLYLDVNPKNGHIKFNFPDCEPWELEETCALDVAEREGGVILEEVGRYMNLTRERVRQVEAGALEKGKIEIGATLGDEEEDDF